MAAALQNELTISVPGSIANLGPGFDTLAVAVQLYMRVRIEQVDWSHPDNLCFHFSGQQLRGENAIERALRHIASKQGSTLPSMRLIVGSGIPMQAGLGSSAAATVAGLRIYEALFGPRPVQELLSLASELEGHCDNAGAALLGGLTSSCEFEDGTITAACWPWPEAVCFIVVTPEVPLKTEQSRRALPPMIPRADAVFNLQRVTLLLQSLQTGNYELLREALRDRWHQPFRQWLVPGLEQVLQLRHPDLLGVCLSGSGPSVVGFATSNVTSVAEQLSAVYTRLGIRHRIRTLLAHREPCREGLGLPVFGSAAVQTQSKQPM